jgi:hypothetical protein
MKLTFLLLAFVAVAVHLFLFAFRYGWYLQPDETRFLVVGYTMTVGALIALWIIFPSRLLVALAGLVAFLFPPVLREGEFVSLSLSFLPYVLLSILLLIGATELRRRIKVRS